MENNIIDINTIKITAKLKELGTPNYFEINHSSVGSLCIEMTEFFDRVIKSDTLTGYMLSKEVRWNDTLLNNKIKFIYLSE